MAWALLPQPPSPSPDCSRSATRWPWGSAGEGVGEAPEIGKGGPSGRRGGGGGGGGWSCSCSPPTSRGPACPSGPRPPHSGSKFTHLGRLVFAAVVDDDHLVGESGVASLQGAEMKGRAAVRSSDDHSVLTWARQEMNRPGGREGRSPGRGAGRTRAASASARSSRRTLHPADRPPRGPSRC